ncbi:FARP2 [Branchiostoma lanceolatum]|uniref:FARP2 protein n=1 Tax=Branchiostoma lanceolatum TaxID=7740 RepID=A0A8K0EA39_BRALA|nr:FARP2 [Branchiostoma lanceolatum]
MSGIEVADNRSEGVELRDVQPRRRPEVGNGGDPPPQQHNNNVPARNGPTSNNRTARKGKCIPVKVLLLDDTLSTFEIQTKACGQELFNAVKDHLQLGESDYFGLEYNDPDGNTTWLDPMKMILKQVKDPKKVMFRFCVKFFSPDPGQLHDEFTRYLFALQVRRDLATGRLPSSDNTAALMASYIVQAEVGDFTAEEHPESSYITEFKFVPNQTPQMENKIMEFHQKLAGQTPADADRNFLDIARRLEMYGIRLHPAHDHDGVKINLAVANMGVLIFQGHTKINTFSWAKIRKLSFKRKRFLIKLHPEAYGLYNATVEFVMSSRDACKSFWKLCIEYHAFFRLEVRPKPVPKSILFSRGSSFRFSGRTQKQLIEEMRDGGSPSKNPKFQRSHKLRASTQSLQIMPTHEVTRLDTNNMRANSFSHYETQDPRIPPYIKPPLSSDPAVVPATQLDKSGDLDEHEAMHDLVGEMTSEHDVMQGLVRQMSSEHDQMQHLVKKITALHADSDEVIDQPDGEKEEAGTPGSEGNDAVPSASSDTGIGNDSPSSAGAISTDEHLDLATNVLLRGLEQADTADTNDNCVQECQGKSPTLMNENPSNLQNLSDEVKATSKMVNNDYPKSASNASHNSLLTSYNNPVIVNGAQAEILSFANTHASFGSGLVLDGSECHIPYQSPCELHITEDEVRPYSTPHNIPLHITEDSSSSSDSCSEPPSAPNSPALHIQKSQNQPCRNGKHKTIVVQADVNSTSDTCMSEFSPMPMELIHADEPLRDRSDYLAIGSVESIPASPPMAEAPTSEIPPMQHKTHPSLSNDNNLTTEKSARPSHPMGAAPRFSGAVVFGNPYALGFNRQESELSDDVFHPSLARNESDGSLNLSDDNSAISSNSG